MITVERVIKPGLQVSFAARNGGTGKKFYSHAQTQGAAGRSKTAIESSWLVTKGASATGKNTSELWDSYLTTKGFTTGPLKDRMKSFFTTGTQA